MGKNSRDTDRDDRRRARRRPVLESFALSSTLPAIGPHRLEVEDLSEIGIGVRLDGEVFGEAGAPHIRVGEALELKLYLNAVLFIPLRLRVARVIDRHEQRQILVGGDFEGSSEGSLHAVNSFLGVLDVLTDSVRLDPLASPSELPGAAAPKNSPKVPAKRASKKASKRA